MSTLNDIIRCFGTCRAAVNELYELAHNGSVPMLDWQSSAFCDWYIRLAEIEQRAETGYYGTVNGAAPEHLYYQLYLDLLRILPTLPERWVAWNAGAMELGSDWDWEDDPNPSFDELVADSDEFFESHKAVEAPQVGFHDCLAFAASFGDDFRHCYDEDLWAYEADCIGDADTGTEYGKSTGRYGSALRALWSWERWEHIATYLQCTFESFGCDGLLLWGDVDEYMGNESEQPIGVAHTVAQALSILARTDARPTGWELL